MFRRSLEQGKGAARGAWPVGALLRCDSCGDVAVDPTEYGDALFCRECREQSEPFYRKDLYTDIGGGD